jgi:hypothetical protein
MRRALLLGSSAACALALSGCPIYPEEPYACSTNADCAKGELCDSYDGFCYVPKPGTGGASGVSCDAPGDCGANETCSKSGQCRIGDCTFHGCVTGWECSSASGVWTCVKSGSGGSGGDAGSGGSAGDAGSSGDAGSAGSGGGAGAAGSAGQAGGGGSAGSAGGLGSGGSAGGAGAPGSGGAAGGAGGDPDAGSADASSD